MGLGGIGPLQLLIVLALVLLIFGTKKLRNLGSDLGASIKGFKNAMGDDDKDKDKDKTPEQLNDGVDKSTIDVKAEKVEEKN